MAQWSNVWADRRIDTVLAGLNVRLAAKPLGERYYPAGDGWFVDGPPGWDRHYLLRDSGIVHPVWPDNPPWTAAPVVRPVP